VPQPNDPTPNAYAAAGFRSKRILDVDQAIRRTLQACPVKPGERSRPRRRPRPVEEPMVRRVLRTTAGVLLVHTRAPAAPPGRGTG
jgi:hypothetical protein